MLHYLMMRLFYKSIVTWYKNKQKHTMTSLVDISLNCFVLQNKISLSQINSCKPHWTTLVTELMIIFELLIIMTLI